MKKEMQHPCRTLVKSITDICLFDMFVDFKASEINDINFEFDLSKKAENINQNFMLILYFLLQLARARQQYLKFIGKLISKNVNNSNNQGKQTRVLETFSRRISCNEYRCQVILSKYRADVLSCRLQARNSIRMTVEKISTSKVHSNVWPSNSISMLPLYNTNNPGILLRFCFTSLPQVGTGTRGGQLGKLGIAGMGDGIQQSTVGSIA